jgi:hypothetical protein
MNRQIIAGMVFCGALILSGRVSAAARCDRASLDATAEKYITAQAKGDPAALPHGSAVKYVENGKPSDLRKGILSKPLKIDFHRSLLDVESCQTYTEVIVTDPTHPHVLGTRLKVDSGKAVEVETLVTDKHDWLFSAKNDLKYSPGENWGVISPDARNDRKTLTDAANAYFNLFMDKSVQVPWGIPCNRLEGGLRTGKGLPDDSCNVGVPSGVDIVDRRFVVDPDIGAVAGLVTFGKSKLPDVHTFRVESGKIRYVHTITVCLVDNCGFPLPAALKEAQ